MHTQCSFPFVLPKPEKSFLFYEFSLQMSPHYGYFKLSFFIRSYFLPIILMAAAAKLLQSCPTLVRPHRWQPTRLLHPWDSPGKKNGVGHSYGRWLHINNIFLYWDQSHLSTCVLSSKFSKIFHFNRLVFCSLLSQSFSCLCSPLSDVLILDEKELVFCSQISSIHCLEFSPVLFFH